MTKSKKRNLIIAAILFLVSVVILKPILFDSRKDVAPEDTVSPGGFEPQFTKEGSLTFLNAAMDTIKTVEMEVADNDAETTQGMMYRSSMSYDRAMLFIMEYESQQSFWMRNTKMSLDIIYVDGQGQIVTIYKHTTPYSESPIPSFKPAKYVVETAAGFCDKFGVKEGDLVKFLRD